MNLPEIKMTKTHYMVMGVAAVLFVGWRIFSALQPPAAEAPIVPVVRTITIGDTASKETAVYPGEVRGRFESNLAFQVVGKIRARHINLGDKVRAGQVLMELDPKDVQQSYNVAQATYQAALSNYEVVKENYKRYTVLYEKGAVSTMTRDEHKTRYDAAASQLESARAQLTASENQMGYTRLVSDHDGVIASISGEVGQVVGAGTPVATVVQDGSREIQIFVPENRLGQIRLNQPATITFWALNNLTATGHIAEIAPMADSVTRTYKVKVAVDSMPEQANLGMTAKVTLNAGTVKSTLVPTGAIYQTGDEAKVWVVRDKKVSLVPVKTAGFEGSDVKITDGLSKGDVVVTGGINKLAEGQEVRLESSETK
jgi:multidrug efflux system membrane fusion protein